ncbi:MAG TPA: enoyl-CoA hydratase-related protein [Actinomycetota bacterium]|nr:enoyl-CoA hydratase-related protein [Actinomycetota bacterium]
MTDEVVLHRTDGPVATITINRPERRNAISPEVTSALSETLARTEADYSVTVVVLTGAGSKAFCAGGDLGAMNSEGAVGQHFMRAEIGELFQQMRKSRLPIVARVNGHALAGGFGLMLACDLVVATADATMGTPEIDIGLWPFMITAVIQRDVPRKLALELMLTGRRLTAVEGERWGFVNRVVEPDDLDGTVAELTESLASKSPLIAALGKRSFYRSEDMDFDESLEYLAGMLTVCLQSEDTAEGVSAFLQKRAPEWKAR